MKKNRILSLLLATVTAAGLFTASMLPVAADENDSNPNSSGMVISKTAKAVTDGFEITLEAYATGSKITTSVNKDVPTDIVLVIDQSGSMDYCIVCGKEIGWNSTHSKDTYTVTYDVNTRNTYYVKDGNNYIQVSYCSGNHSAVWGSNTQCSGGAGWYKYARNAQASDHTATARYTPMTSATSDGVQFYTKSTTNESCSPRLSALKTAVTTFVNSVNEKAKGADGQYGTDDDVNHRIAVVGFASGSGSSDPYLNTELFIGSDQYNYYKISYSTDRKTLASSKYSDAFQDMNNSSGYSNVISSINNFDASGATYVSLGIDMANNIFQANQIEDNEERNRVMIVFTDGSPAKKSSYSSDVADDAIENAKTTKNNYGATVYTVGVFEGADGSTPSNLTGLSNENKFLHLVSSNYPNAQGMNNTGNVNDKLNGKTYYLDAGDEESLDNIFKQIADEIESGGSSTTLGSETVIKDIIAPQFELPANATASDIALETYACTGVNAAGEYTWSKNEDSMGARATVNGDKVDVTGFDFSTNWCGTETTNGDTTYRGNKLVIKFTVQTKDGFLGGNDVYTNTSAGVYENADAETAVQEFPRPTVNVPIQDVTVTAEDKNVYLLGNLTAEQIKSGATVKCGDVELNLVADNYGLESWQTEYVNIGDLKIVDADGNEVNISDYQNLKDDTTYRLELTISPKTDGSSTTEGTVATARKNAADNGIGKINVFKPELTFKDSVVYNGNNEPTQDDYNSKNYKESSTVWKHNDTLSTDNTINMIGTVPTLTFAYTPDSSQIKDGKINANSDKIGVEVKVSVNGTEIDDAYVLKFNHECGVSEISSCPELTDSYKFWLHILSTELTITKTVDKKIDGQSFLFTVTLGDGTTFKVVIDADEFTENTATITIKDLKVGQSCTVTEDTSWSWRYEVDGKSEVTQTLSANKNENNFEFKNKLTTEEWLGEETFVENYWTDQNTIMQNPTFPLTTVNSKKD